MIRDDRDEKDESTEGESSNDKLPGQPNPDDPTPLGDTDQHSDVPSPPADV